jgi:hypothetical protein
MGWAGPFELPDGRLVGYAVEAECDHPDCDRMIDRGLAYCCGTMHNAEHDDGCGFYFCEAHRWPDNHLCEWQWYSDAEAAAE